MAAQDWLPEPLPPRGGLEADWLGMVAFISEGVMGMA